MASGIGIRLTNVSFPTSFPTLRWSPQTLGSNLAAWLDPAHGATVSGSSITQLVDQSPNGIVLTPTSAGLAPVYNSNARNGRPGAYNTVAGTGMQHLAAAANDPRVNFGRSQPFSFAIALITGSGAGANGKFALGCTRTDGQPSGWFLDTSTNTWTNNTGRKASFVLTAGPGNSLSASSSTLLASATPYIIVVTYNGSGTPGGVTMTVNGVSQTVGASQNTLTGTPNASSNKLFVCSPPNTNSNANFWSDDVVLEAFIGSTTWDADTISQATGYLNRKYAAF